jgi:hypothetical protein
MQAQKTSGRLAEFRRFAPWSGRNSAEAAKKGPSAAPAGGMLSASDPSRCHEGEPEMPAVLPSRSTPIRTYSAIALFLLVYVGVMVLVFAPRDFIAVQSGAAFYGAED